MKRILLAGLAAWTTALLALLFVSFVSFETPGLQDAMGYGGYLLIGGTLLIAIVYLPIMHLVRKRTAASQPLIVLPGLMAIAGNAPVYLLLWLSNRGFGPGEALLFTLGFFLLAYMFCTVMLWPEPGMRWRIVALTVAPAITTAVVFFDYQFFYQDAAHGIVSALPDMASRRSAHTATVLPDGKILIVGGIITAEGAEINSATAEIFNPITRMFEEAGTLSVPRAGHTATLLHDGSVLITGGFYSEGFHASAELYDARTRVFSKVNSDMTESRAAHTATRLDNSKVLLAGGVNDSGIACQSADLFDPASGGFTPAGKMTIPRTGHTATLLNDGRVLFVGGSLRWRSEVTARCEVYDPTSLSFAPVSGLNIPRNKHLAVLLPDSRVLVVGGSSTAADISGRYSSVEAFDPAKNSFSWLECSLMKSRFKITNAGDVLGNGTVVVGGDGKYVEVYYPCANGFFTAQGNVDKAWMYPTVTTISSTQVLITGGYDSRMQTTAGAWLFEIRIDQGLVARDKNQ